ncbi:MAG: GIY-YIG nuclease family protein [Acidobacteriia bacterium]|nr:GIY-YIG nuclease family protein [Terriglobia bacterium]
MYFVYILRSLKDNRFYIGSTQDVEKRIRQHNAGYQPATRHRIPFELVHVESFQNRSEATARERYLKKLKSHHYVEQWILTRRE